MVYLKLFAQKFYATGLSGMNAFMEKCMLSCGVVYFVNRQIISVSVGNKQILACRVNVKIAGMVNGLSYFVSFEKFSVLLNFIHMNRVVCPVRNIYMPAVRMKPDSSAGSRSCKISRQSRLRLDFGNDSPAVDGTAYQGTVKFVKDIHKPS